MKRMTTKLYFVTAVLVMTYAVAGFGVGLEIGVGTEPSVSFAAVWDLSPSLSLVTTFGVAFGGDVQTGSVTVQTGSLTAQTALYTTGAELRYNVRLASSFVRPYLGVGAFAQMSSGDISVLLSSSAGMQIRMLPNIYLLGEGSVFVPIFDVSGWYWRLKLGAGFRFQFYRRMTGVRQASSPEAVGQYD